MTRKKLLFFAGVILTISGIYMVSQNWKMKSKVNEKVSEKRASKSRLSRNFKRDIESFNQLKFMKKYPDFKRKKLNFTIQPWKFMSNSIQKSDVDYSMIILIKSHANNTRRRNFIGNTWGTRTSVNGFKFATVFIVGMSNAKDNAALQKENENHGDLLQTTFPETYENLVYKTLAGMQWAADNFPKNWFYASMDDDVLPDLVKISNDLLKIIECEKARRSSKDSISIIDFPVYCGFGYRIKPRPKRFEESKWFMTEDKYPLKRYPPYCFGGFYSMTVKLAHNLYELSRSLPLFWIDDIWITGIVRLKYFLENSSQCTYCKVMNLTMGLWTEYPGDYTSVMTGDENFLANKWVELRSKIGVLD